MLSDYAPTHLAHGVVGVGKILITTLLLFSYCYYYCWFLVIIATKTAGSLPDHFSHNQTTQRVVLGKIIILHQLIPR